MACFRYLFEKRLYLSGYQLMMESGISRSQFYQWLGGVKERKSREEKWVSEAVVTRAVQVIRAYPHLGAVKAQCYMVYHQLGYIPQHVLRRLKKMVKRLIFQEVSGRKLLPSRTSYEHERGNKVGEIWAEDFTWLRVCGHKFYTSVVIDVYDNYYLGAVGSRRVNSEVVAIPVAQAVTANGGQGPERFLLSDNGSTYTSGQHGQLLDKLSIVQKRIPSCKPEYNGSVECGIKEFKNVFYNVWAGRETSRSAKGKNLDERVQLCVTEAIKKLNEEIPRPRLKGITAADVHTGVSLQKIEKNRQYLEQQLEQKQGGPGWNKDNWQLVKDSLKLNEMSDVELITKFCFFLKRPLRKLTKWHNEVLGN